MPVNASVFVINGDVDKALRVLKNKLRKQGLLGYDQKNRRYQEGTKRKRGKKKVD